MSANPEKPPRKQQQRSIRTKQKLLDAALEAFSEHGFRGTSTRNIAERAGVHHPLITYHFKNKEELWRAAADRIFTDFNTALAAAAAAQAGECPKARMSALIRAYVHYAAGQPALHKIMVQEASRPSRRLDWLISTHIRPLFAAAVEEIKVIARTRSFTSRRPEFAVQHDPGVVRRPARAVAGTQGHERYRSLSARPTRRTGQHDHQSIFAG